jgi:hypothetical protein
MNSLKTLYARKNHIAELTYDPLSLSDLFFSSMKERFLIQVAAYLKKKRRFDG